jgi:hypothetical protein
MLKIILYLLVFFILYSILFYDNENFVNTNLITGNTNLITGNTNLITSNDVLINKIIDIKNNNTDIKLLFNNLNNSNNINNILETRQSNLTIIQNEILDNIFTDYNINIYDEQIEDKIYTILKYDKEKEELSIIIKNTNLNYNLTQDAYYNIKLNKLKEIMETTKINIIPLLKKDEKILYLWLVIQFTTVNVDKWKEFVQFYSWLNFTSTPEYRTVFTADVQNELINILKNKKNKNRQLENDEIYESELIYQHLNKLWYIKFEQLKEYVKEYNEYPPVKSELGKWYQEQLYDFNNPKKYMTNIVIYNKWYNYINNIPESEI